MKKNYFLLLLVTVALHLLSCTTYEETVSDNPFDTISENANNVRDKIVVISDLHLGNDFAYSENVKHLKQWKEHGCRLAV